MIRVSYSITLILSALHSSTLLQERDVEDVSGWARSDIVKLASILTWTTKSCQLPSTSTEIHQTISSCISPDCLGCTSPSNGGNTSKQQRDLGNADGPVKSGGHRTRGRKINRTRMKRGWIPALK